jgi:hypothetical protein
LPHCYAQQAYDRQEATVIDGLGADAPVVTNDQGGRQADSPYFFRGLPPLALAAVARCMKEKAQEYDKDTPGGPFENVLDRNWHKIPEWSHLEHAYHHLIAEVAGDTADDHLTHLATRALMALHLREARKARENQE